MEQNLTFHHFGVACNDIEKTAAAYAELGYLKGETIIDPLQNIKICFLNHSTMPLVELLEPVDDKSPVVQILQKNGTTPYHTCYSVDNLESVIREFKRLRYLIVSKPKTACAIDGRKVAFMYNPDMGLIELVEK